LPPFDEGSVSIEFELYLNNREAFKLQRNAALALVAAT
jgi:hypothetical protein